MFIVPGLSDLYYIELQRLAIKDLPLVRVTALLLVFFPFSVAIRAQSEGLSAWQKKPITVLAGHTTFLAIVIVSGFILLYIGLPGYFIGTIGLTLGSLASSATMRLSLGWVKEEVSIPVSQTTTSVGQIR